MIGGPTVDPSAATHDALSKLSTSELLKLANDGKLDPDTILALANERAAGSVIEHDRGVGTQAAPSPEAAEGLRS